MGTKSVKFTNEADKQKEVFDHTLLDLKYLRKMIEKGMLNRETPRIGAEQELVIIDQAYRPAPIATEFLEGFDDPHYTTELARFNLEVNLDPLEFTGDCFSKMEENLNQHIKSGQKRLNELGDYQFITTGILPTFRKMDMELKNLTPNERSKAMMEAMKWLKKEDYSIRIEGMDELNTIDFSNMFESANTSFQIHYQVNPDEFIDKYNFAQAIAAPVLAACTNSATLFGKRLWHETRIGLFQQAVDTRESTAHLSEAYLRVPFGNKWAENSVVEVFEEDLAKFKIFLQHPEGNDTQKRWEKDEVPKLVNLDVFNSSVFRWTRACYGVLDGKPHLRIENRLLPSGPTIVDEVANSAFWLGLLHGMPEEYQDIAKKMNFEDCKINILKAARYGLDTQFRWLGGEKIKSEDLIINELLPIAREGLKKANVEEKDIDRYLNIIQKRVETGQTGSQWAFDAWAKLSDLKAADSKNAALTAAMLKRQQSGKPVHEWTLPEKEELTYYSYSEVGHFMSTKLFTVTEDDLLDQTIFNMIKKNYAHIPVADKNGNLKGLLSKSLLLEHEFLNKVGREKKGLKVKDVMESNPVTVEPSTPLTEAVELMKKNKIRCLPVIYEDKLAGILTQFDMLHVVEFCLKNVKTD